MDADDLVLLVERVVMARLAGLYGLRPGRVQSYDATNQTAVVQPEPMERGKDVAPVAPSVLSDVPVVWLRGGGASMTFPLGAGDRVMLLGATADLDEWRDAGGLTDPGEDRRWDPSDVVAIPGLWPRSGKLAAAQASATAAVLEPPPGGLKIGGGATKAAARVDDPVGVGSLVLTGALNVLTVTYTPPGGAPQTQSITLTNPSPGTVVVAAAGTGATLAGKITAGSAKTQVE